IRRTRANAPGKSGAASVSHVYPGGGLAPWSKFVFQDCVRPTFSRAIRRTRANASGKSGAAYVSHVYPGGGLVPWSKFVFQDCGRPTFSRSTRPCPAGLWMD
ncbi:MAG: hypothetical protein FWB75_08945, partial [Oscillospiraceae bacterium]|nr:hypothetical protein [Oscillospiraceae bacterium]